MQNLISIVPKIINDKFNTISTNLTIKDNWNKILGDDFLISSNRIYQLMQFDKAVFSVAGDVSTLNVIINVIGSAIIFAKAKIETIKKSIKLLTGINNINIVLHQVSGLKNLKKEAKLCL